MWSLTPMFLIVLCVIITGTLLLAVIWLDKFPKIEQKYGHPICQVLRGAFFTVYLYWAILILDTVVKISFLGILGYNNFSYHLAPMLLGLILSLVIVVGVGLNAPTIKSLLSFIGITIYSIYYLQGPVSKPDVGEMDAFFVPIQMNLIIVAGVYTVFFVIERVSKYENNHLWDISKKYKKIINKKFYISMFVLVFVEFILRFEGLSLLYWLF